MKHFFTLSVMLMVMVGYTNAQNVKLKGVRKVKESQLIIGLSGDDTLDESLRKTVEKFWDFSKISGAMPLDKAIDKAKSQDNLVVLKVDSETSMSSLHGNSVRKPDYRNRPTGSLNTSASSRDMFAGSRDISSGYYMEIMDHRRKSLVKTYIPAFGEGEEDLITDEIVAFGTSSLQYLCKTMDEKNYVNSNSYHKKIYSAHSAQLKEKSIYIPEGWLGKKMNAGEIEKEYPTVKVVSYETWKEAILSRKEGIVYSIIAPIPVMGNYIYVHYLVGASDGTVYGKVVPKSGVNIHGINVSKSNTGYVNKKILKEYAKIIASK